MQDLPGLKTKKGAAAGRLLRKPRAPTHSFSTSQQSAHPFLNPKEVLNNAELPDDWDCLSQFTPSVVPSLASPPPSEYNRRNQSGPGLSPNRLKQNDLTLSPVVSPLARRRIQKNDQKYILDPVYSNSRERSSQSNTLQDATGPGYVEGENLVKPFKPRGPEGFPMRVHRQPPDLHYDLLWDEDDLKYFPTPLFTLNEFLLHVSQVQSLPLKQLQKVVLSRHNYKKLTKLLAKKHLPKSKHVTSVNFNEQLEDIPAVHPRVPNQQLLIEMASLVKEQLKEALNTDVRAVIKPLPKYKSPYKPGEGPHTEIVIFEEGKEGRVVRFSGSESQSDVLRKSQSRDNLFNAATARFFQGGPRSNSPFVGDDKDISPSELAILDALMSGGTALSLKAHFITFLPDISPVAKTVTYLNLSFNDLRCVPSELFDMQQLEVLKLRDNPIRDIPMQIVLLKNLRTLTLSFCLISSVPISLFSLPELRHLDLSYNRLVFIPNEIRNALKLRELNLEGNQLPAMPCGALKLKLRYLRVANNFMHPLFWEENTKNNPQRLLDLSALAFSNAGLFRLYKNIPEGDMKILNSYSTCDCCSGPRYGPGIRLIRPCNKIFGVKNLPFLFRSCSPYCAKVFSSSTDTIMDIIYGDDDGGPSQ
ncbi:leucine-rich repeat-containing protein 63-like isoform X2 [Lineus longissimus]